MSNSRILKKFFWGKTQFFKNIFGASSAHFIYNTVNRAISSRETKSLTEVGAVKCEQWLYNIGTPFERSMIARNPN